MDSPAAKSAVPQIDATQKLNAAEGRRPYIILPDGTHGYKLNFSKEAVSQVSVVDVDVIITLVTGESFVLAEAALAAMSTGDAQVYYSDGQNTIAALVGQSGIATLPAHADLTSDVAALSYPLKIHEAEKNNIEPTSGSGSGISVNVIPPDTKIEKQIENALQSQSTVERATLPSPYKPFEVTLSLSSSAASKPNSFTSNFTASSEVNALSASVYANASNTVSNGIYYGGYGSSNAETDSAYTAQMETVVVSGFTAGTQVNANPSNSTTFLKVIRLTYAGGTTPQTITISNFPSTAQVVGAQVNGDGSYTIDASNYTVVNGNKVYDIPVQYTLYPNSDGTTVHESYTVKFDFYGINGNATLHQVVALNVKIADAVTASDLSGYVGSTSSNTVILSAQGANYEFTALGHNTITGGTNADLVYSTVAGNVLDGGAGTNTLNYKNAGSGLLVDVANGIVSTTTSSDSINRFQKIIGSAYSDTFIANSSTLLLDGGAGGNDTFNPNGAGSITAPLTITGSASGANLLDLTGSSGAVSVDVGNGLLTGADGVAYFSNIQMVNATAYADTIKGGSSGSVTIDGGGGADNIIGGLGNMVLTYAQSNAGVTVDLVNGRSTGYGAGVSTLSGNIQQIIGSAYDDMLIGNKSFTRALDGGAGGNDTFDPGGGGTASSPVTITGSSNGINLITLANDAAGFGALVDLTTGSISGGYGTIILSNIQEVIGTRYSDTMTAAPNTLLLDGGSGGDDVFDTNHAQNITVKASGTGLSTLTLANETGLGAAGAERVDLAQGSMSGAYGQATLVNINKVIGTAYGDDTLVAGTRAVEFVAGAGNVSLAGSTLGDTLRAGGGNTTISGGGGSDLYVAITGSTQSQYVIETGTGNDTIVLGQGTSYVSLYGGNDSLSLQSNSAHVQLDFTNSGLPVTGGLSVDLVNNIVNATDNSSVIISGTGHIESLIGSAGSDKLRGTSGTIFYDGGISGNDSFDVSTLANATIHGSATGQNSLMFHDGVNGVSVDMTNGTYSVGGIATGEFSNIKTVQGTDFADSFTLSADNLAIVSGNGDDTILGGSGNATITVGSGNDSISLQSGNLSSVYSVTAGNGNDTIDIGPAADVTLALGAGDYHVKADQGLASSVFNITAGQSGSDVFDLGDGTGTINLTAGGAVTASTIDFLFATDVNSAYTVKGGTSNVILLGAGSYDITGGAGNDFIIAGNGSARITGNGGNDRIQVLNAANDAVAYTINGGSGNDSIHVGQGQFSINGASGSDTITVDETTSLNSSYSIAGGRQNTIQLGSGSATVTGGSGADKIDAGSGAATIAGGGGQDTLTAIHASNESVLYSITGGNGNDQITLGQGIFRIDGNGGFDTITVSNQSTNNSRYLITGGASNVITLGAGIATVTGGTGSDSIVAGTGSASINGNGGNDTLIANASIVDTTRYTLMGGANNDSISVGQGQFTITGNGGADTISVTNQSTQASTYSIVGGDSGFISLGAGLATVIGGIGDDSIVAGSGSASISGHGGNDTINALMATDDATRYTLMGGSGNDRISIGKGQFSITGNGGTDTISVTAQATDTSTYSIVGGDSNFITLSKGLSSVLGGGGNDTIIVGSGAATITGNGGNDNVTAVSALSDQTSYSLITGAGNDTIVVGRGAFSISGGSGTDSITVNNDTEVNSTYQINGGTSNVMRLGAGTYSVIGGSGNDSIAAGIGAATISGNGGTDTITAINAVAATTSYSITGGTGDDFITVGKGTFTIAGVSGADTIVVDGSSTSTSTYSITGGTSNVITLAAGIYSVVGGSGNDNIIAGVGAATISGNGGADTINAINAATETTAYSIKGDAGNDVITVGKGAFTIAGNGGADTISVVSSSTANSTFLISGGTSNVMTLAAGIYSITGGSGNDSIVAGVGAATISGNGGSDTITAIAASSSSTAYSVTGGAGNDFITVGQGAFTIAGVGGVDTINVDSSSTSSSTYAITGGTSNRITLGAGTSTVTGGIGNDSIVAGSGDATILGNGGADTITAISAATDATTYSITGGAGNDSITLGQGNFIISGNGGADTIIVAGSSTSASSYSITGGVSNTVVLGAGSATVTGGLGNDFISAGSGAAVISGNGGQDTINAVNAATATTSYIIFGGTGNDSITVGQGAIRIAGSGGADTITVTNASTFDSTYTINGGASNTIKLGAGTAIVTGGSGNDSITAGSGNATITGNGGSDTITAIAGTASSVYSITAGTGNDQFKLGLGTVTLNGGGGADSITVVNQGNYTWSFATAVSGVSVNMASGFATVSGATETVTGGTLQTIIGSSFNDTLVAGSGKTLVLDGGAGGTDSFNLNYAGTALAPVTLKGNSASANLITFANDTVSGVNLDITTGLVSGGYGYGDITGASIKNITGSSFADTFTLSSVNATVSGGVGADSFVAMAGLDASSVYSLTGGTSGDRFTLGKGNFVVAGGGGADTIIANTGTTNSVYSITTASGNDSLTIGLGNYTIDAGGGNDTLNFTSQGNITLSFANDTLSGINANLAVGGSITAGAYGSTTLIGGTVQKITGTALDDTLKGSSSTLVLNGGSGGNDVFDIGGAGTVAAPVTVTGNSNGTNVLTFASDTIGGVTVDLSLGNVSGNYGVANISGANIKSVIGSSFNDTITSNSLAVTIDGGGGNDKLYFTGVSVASGKIYSLSSLAGIVVNMSGLDLSKNKNTASDIGYNYQISTADIVSMAPSGSRDISITTYSNGTHQDTHTVFTSSGQSYTEVGNVGSFIANGQTYTVHWLTVATH